MSIGLGDTVTNDCQAIKAGTLVRLFSTYDSDALLPLIPLPVNQHPTLNSRKEDYITVERNERLVVCDQPNFAKKWWLKRMKVRKMPKCPWMEHAAAIYKVEVLYNEALNPINGIDSPLVVEFENWPTGEFQHDGTYTTESINAPWDPAYSSDGVGECRITVTQVDSDASNPGAPVTIHVRAELIRFGRPYDFLTGGTVVEVREVSCEDWLNGASVSGFWVGTAFPIGPIGIVMSMAWGVTGGAGFIG